MSDHGSDAYPSDADHVPRDPAPRQRLGPTALVLIGVLVGALLAIVLLWVLRGNPFSSVNEVVYSEVIVGSVTDDEDQICWAQDPDRRDSQQECAILALDPELEVPEAGDLVTIGLVRFRTPDDSEFLQVVHVGPAEAEGASIGSTPLPTDGPSPDEDASPTP
jgi:hypothetical protein